MKVASPGRRRRDRVGSLRQAWLAVGAAVTAAAGCGEVELPSDAAMVSGALTGGTPDPGDPAIVAILFGGHAACTGVLVGERVVLTAAHCLLGESIPPRVLFGAASASTEAVAIVDVEAVFVHAEFSPLAAAHDIAALRLGADASSGVLPVSLPSPSGVAVADAGGATVRLIGYGHPSPGGQDGLHLKREGTASVSRVAADTLDLAPAPSQACLGDSGGPVLLRSSSAEGEVLIGLILSGVETCTAAVTALRIDRYLASFIAPILADAAPRPPQGRKGSDRGCAVAPHHANRPAGWAFGALAASLALFRPRRRPRRRPPKRGGQLRGGIPERFCRAVPLSEDHAPSIDSWKSQSASNRRPPGGWRRHRDRRSGSRGLRAHGFGDRLRG